MVRHPRILKARRAQITAFIIIAIVLLFSSALVLYIRNRVTSIQPADVEIATQDVPLIAKPVQNYIEECIRELSIDGFKKMGENGGYISLHDTEISGMDLFIDPLRPTRSDAVTFPGSNKSVAYWWYLPGEINQDRLGVGSYIPLVGEIEMQNNLYVTAKLVSCLENLTVFEDMGFSVVEAGDIETQTYIGEDDISVYVQYPMTVQKDDKTAELVDYLVKIDIDFKEIYTLAHLITILQKDYLPLEFFLQEFMNYQSGLDINLLPPTYASVESFSPIYWTKVNVERQIKDIILSFVPFLRISGTKGADEIILPAEHSYEEGIYANMLMNISTETFANQKVRFMYLDWPIYFNIKPSRGQLITPRVEPDTFPDIIPITTQTLVYNFYYDIAFPVIVAVSDDSALNGEGYTLYFALEANIKDNRNLLYWYAGYGTIDLGDHDPVDFDMPEMDTSDVSLPDDVSQAYSDNDEPLPDIDDEIRQGMQGLPVPRQQAARNLFNNPEQRVGSDVTIMLSDSITSEPVDEALISYSCGDYASTVIGQTSIDPSSGDSILNEKFPVCINGKLTIEKAGYFKKTLELTSITGGEKTLNVNLNPFVYIDVHLQKYQIEIINDRLKLTDSSIPLGIEPNDKVIITIERILESPDDEMLSETLIVDQEQFTIDEPIGTVRLVPGKYNIDISYLDNNGITIPAFCKSICVDRCMSLVCCHGTWRAYGCDGTEYYMRQCMEYDYLPKEEIVVGPPAPMGGLMLNENTVQFTVSQSDLRNSQKFILSFLRIPNPPCIDELEWMGETEALSRFYANTQLKPEFS